MKKPNLTSYEEYEKKSKPKRIFLNKTNIKSKKKVITPDMGVDKELIDFGKKVLTEALFSQCKQK